MRRVTFVASMIVALAALPAAGRPTLNLIEKDVKQRSGTVVRVEAGELQVPESRKRPSPRRLTIPFYRLKSQSSSPATPIFLLAGGPGSSWLDNFTYEEPAREAAFYRTVADVVLFDQRGGGHSQPEMDCPKETTLPFSERLDLDLVRTAIRSLVTVCRDHWQQQGVDLAAYNTVENAADVNDLRLALGYKKITLIGGSYGSHLALQMMRQFPDAIERVVIFGVEGPDHTWDSPTGRLNTLERIARATEASPAFAGAVPAGGLIAALKRVVDRLDKEPATVTVSNGKESRQVVVDGALIRRAVAIGAGRRNAPNAWPEMILAFDRGDYTMAARSAMEVRRLKLPDPMHFSMDCSSGASDSRKALSRTAPARALLGDINAEYETVCDLWPFERLGPSFHAPVVSPIPTVVIHGTWDMSTPLDNAREVAASLKNAQLVEVVGGNHGALYNLFERWPPMYKTLGNFLRGTPVTFPSTIDDMAEIVFKKPATPSRQ